ncbi:MAG: tyrosine-protein phosphatase [Yoonia sp.]|nr:tyrosine-protein phosphatase [Yoonia sp.]
MFQKLATTLGEIVRSARPDFGPVLVSPEERALALAHLRYHDHGILRGRWTNMAEIAPGVWRSNQPDPDRIARYAQMGIKTILNLRGQAQQSHYLLEKEACDAHGIALVNMKFSARVAAPKELYLALLDQFDAITPPLLIHCKSGADRTGLAAAFYLLHVENVPIAQARAQLALKYVHLKWSYLFGLFCGLAKVHLVSVHAAFSVSDLPKYAMSGVRLSRAV